MARGAPGQEEQRIEAIIREFDYNGNPISYRGSLLTGWRGPHKGQTAFNAKNFDVDMYVVDAVEFDRIASLMGRTRPPKWIKGDAVYAPEFMAVSTAVVAALTQEFPEVKGLGDSKVILRRREPGA